MLISWDPHDGSNFQEFSCDFHMCTVAGIGCKDTDRQTDRQADGDKQREREKKRDREKQNGLVLDFESSKMGHTSSRKFKPPKPTQTIPPTPTENKVFKCLKNLSFEPPQKYKALNVNFSYC